jgi:manganese/zinc/iron transport system substrate-binding protein
MRADLVFYSGLMLEGKMADLFERLSSKRPVFAVTRGLSEQKLLREAEANEDIDPHVWMDIRLWRGSLETVAQALAEFDPERAELYRERAAGYDQRLQRLHAYGESVLASIPPERRVLVTSHDAFRYLGQAYGLEVVGIQGLSTESEAGLQQINRLVDLLVERRIQAVFVESSVSSKSIMSLVDGARSRDHQVAIGGELYSDAMGMVGTYEGTYEGMMDHNLTTITRGLGGTAPPRGYRDLLAAPRD